MAKKSRKVAAPVSPQESPSASEDEMGLASASAPSVSSSRSSPAQEASSDSESESEALSAEDDSDDETPARSSPPSKKRKRAELEPLPILEDEALSHAEKRRQKKKQLKTEDVDASVHATSAKEGTTRSEVAARAPRQHSIWVGNLSFKTTEADIRKFFVDAGEVTRVNLPLKPVQTGQPAAKWASTRENRGYVIIYQHSVHC